MNVSSHKFRLVKLVCISFILVGTLFTSICAAEIIRIGGAGSGLGAMKILAESFEKSHPGTTIKILPSLGSSGGIKALLHGALDLAISGRVLKAEEMKEGAFAAEYARTPFVFVVNRNVKKVDVTTRELEMIYKRQLLKWPDGSRLRLVLRPTGDTDTMIVKSISREMEQAVNVSNSQSEMILAVTDQEALDAVAKIPGALGGTTLTQIETEKHPVHVLSFNGIKPTLGAMAQGSYPLAKPLFIVSTDKTSSMVKQFIQFAHSAKGRAILTASGAVPTANDKKSK